MKNVNSGHRKRLKQRYLKEGIENFEHHNVLELLLFYALPRVDTNKIAHNLIKRFGTISGVFHAPIEELVKVKGIGENAAILINLIPQLMKVYAIDDFGTEPLDSSKKMCGYLTSCFIGTLTEEVRVICLDDRLRVISNDVLFEGAVSRVEISARKIVETAFRNNSDLIILSHNHPNGDEIPSEQDIVVTRHINNTLKAVNIKLLDHIIVGKNRTSSMRDGGYFYDW